MGIEDRLWSLPLPITGELKSLSRKTGCNVSTESNGEQGESDVRPEGTE